MSTPLRMSVIVQTTPQRSSTVAGMADTAYARVLDRALQLDGSTQGLATLLRVPEATLLRWRSGRAFMPVNTFKRLLAYVAEAEITTPTPAPAIPVESLRFSIGPLAARCAGCDGVDFRPAEPAAPLKMVSTLLCSSCGTPVTQGDLLARLGDDLVERHRAKAMARVRLSRSSPPTPSPPSPTSQTRSS